MYLKKSALTGQDFVVLQYLSTAILLKESNTIQVFLVEEFLQANMVINWYFVETLGSQYSHNNNNKLVSHEVKTVDLNICTH